MGACNEDWRLAEYAVAEVRRLREEHSAIQATLTTVERERDEAQKQWLECDSLACPYERRAKEAEARLRLSARVVEAARGYIRGHLPWCAVFDFKAIMDDCSCGYKGWKIALDALPADPPARAQETE